LAREINLPTPNAPRAIAGRFNFWLFLFTRGNHDSFIMKRTLILSSILFSVISVQADLVIHQHQIISIKPGSNETNSVIFSIRGDKTRSEVMHGDITNVFIYDLATHDSATLTD
jgi:hypothetical protein